MERLYLTEYQWNKIYKYLQAHPKIYVKQEKKSRDFLEAVLWILRSGSQWRLLPAEKGCWNSIFKRYSRWCKQGIWEELLVFVSDDADLQQILMDSTVVRSHACAAGAKKTSEGTDEALGRSRGGFSTKIHALTDALGNPLVFLLTGGEKADISYAAELLDKQILQNPEITGTAFLADRGYDADSLLNTLSG